MPKVNRTVAVMVSMPMEPRKSPETGHEQRFPHRAAGQEGEDGQPHDHQGKILRRAELQGHLGKGGAMSIKPTIDKVPAMKEAKAAIPRAGPALPWRAIW